MKKNTMKKANVKKINIKNDPFREREESKYEDPIASREYIIQHLEELGKPTSFERLAYVFDLRTPEKRAALERRLRAMWRDGQLISTRRGSYALVKHLALVRGRVSVRKEGYGFVIPDDGSNRVFLLPNQLRCVFHGDKVLASITRTADKGKREGAIVEVLEQCTKQVVGRYVKEGGVSYIISSNKNIHHDVFIPRGKANGAKPGQIVIADIIAYPTFRNRAQGKIVKILGEHMDPGLEIETAIHGYSLPFEWPAEVLQAVKSLPKNINPQAKQDRKNLIQFPFVTIDGKDAKDFDDAVYCKPLEKEGWQLYVAIADVSHYVKPDSALDKEAAERGNSIYFPRQVIPMLPEILSNDLCSLKPAVERFSLVCEMVISPTGKIKRYYFYQAIIRSRARLTYTEVFDLLHGRSKKQAALLPHLQALYDVYRALKKERKRRGALDFVTTETRIIFGAKGKIKKIVPREHNYAHEIIEECMLAANVCTAKFLSRGNIPILYRIHAGPDADKLENLRSFLSGLALKLTGGNHPQPIDYAKILQKASGRPDAHIIQIILLRSMQQALYTTENIGHFGLAYSAYTHFTSPIRRYPDLLNHRAICYLLNNASKKKCNTYAYDHNTMQNFGEHCSMTERRADEATRDVIDWLKCEYMLDKVGQTFDGIVSGVMSFGLFVELKDILVEGLLHITALKNDYYRFDPINHRLEGKRTRARYQIGDPIKVLVARVDVDEREIDFDLVEEE